MLKEKVQQKLNTKTRPYGALGVLEDMALQIALIQNTATPSLRRPSILIFASDHGISQEGISRFDRDLTYEMANNILSGTSPINVFAKASRMNVRLVDMGVARPFDDTLAYWLHKDNMFVDRKIALGTQNFLEKPAMSTAQCEKAMEIGTKQVQEQKALGTNTIGFGDLGVGNTSSATILAAALLDTDVTSMLNAEKEEQLIAHKIEVLEKAHRKHPKSHDPLTILTVFGGFEIAALVGAMLRAASYKMTILIDGFTTAAALLCAYKINPNVLEYCLFAHGGGISGHKRLLKELKAQPILNTSISLGEATGVALAYPILKNSVRLLSATEKEGD